MSRILKTTLFRAWRFPSIQKSSTIQTTAFKPWWCIDFLILDLNIKKINDYMITTTETYIRRVYRGQPDETFDPEIFEHLATSRFPARLRSKNVPSNYKIRKIS